MLCPVPGSKKGRHLSQEARERLSQLAKQRHAEGKFGGREFGKLGGRPRKERAAKRIAEAAQEEANAKAITQVFKDGVSDRQPMGTRLAAAKLWVEIEREEAKVALQEESLDHKDLSRDQLIEALSKKLSSGAASLALRQRLLEQETGVVDAEVVEEDERAA
jgi:hypothetical protein